MTWAKWDPFRELDALSRDFDRVFGQTGFGRAGNNLRNAFTRLSGGTGPQMRLSEQDDNVTVELLVPGADADSLSIQVEGDSVKIEGKRAGLGDDANAPERIYRNERPHGQFSRTLRVPVEIDAERVAARYEEGILTVTLPKSEKARPRQIKVQAA